MCGPYVHPIMMGSELPCPGKIENLNTEKGLNLPLTAENIN